MNELASDTEKVLCDGVASYLPEGVSVEVHSDYDLGDVQLRVGTMIVRVSRDFLRELVRTPSLYEVGMLAFAFTSQGKQVPAGTDEQRLTPRGKEICQYIARRYMEKAESGPK